MIQEHYRVRQLPPEAAPNGEILHAAYVEELPSCIGQGSTPEEAERMARSFLAKSLERLRLAGLPVPAPLGRGMDLHPIPQVQPRTAATAVFVKTDISVSVLAPGVKLGTWSPIGERQTA